MAAKKVQKFSVRVKRGLAGLGLYAEQDIPKGKFVIEYTGELITDDEADQRGGKYLFQLGNGKTIDGKGRENVGRYINHGCRPNCETDVVGNRVYISTIRSVKAGDELTYDYGKEYFDFYIKPHGCRCAAHAVKKTAAKKGVAKRAK